ncbi:MAG: thiol-disulfide oxidoreductase DCC family protein [Betaproteobacteria bacterium]|jgi:predicted DCC family thiol-disulfide oxidoreductase YuxK
MNVSLYPLTIYYDGTCPRCTAEIDNLRLRDADARLRFVDCSPADFVSPIPGADRSALMNVIHAVGAQGTVLLAVDVFEAAYRAVGLPWVSRVLVHPFLRPVADRVYPWIVRNRYRLPRALIRGLFERAARRAAEQAAARNRCVDEACRMPPQGRS